MNWDEIVQFEQECYQEGFEQGTAEAQQHLSQAGYSSGMKIGFEKFLPVGILQGRVEGWRRAPRCPAKAVSTLSELVEPGSLENSPDEVEKVDRRKRVAINKAKVLASRTMSTPVNLHETLTEIIRANAEKNSNDEMF